MKCFVLIPSRYNSLRLPKKSLIKIDVLQETLVEHVFKKCIESNLADSVYVLTDHESIVREVNKFSNNVIMTDSNLVSGTDRVYHGAKILGASDNDLIINVQGDMVMLEPSLIDDLINAYILQKEQADMFTFAHKVSCSKDIDSLSEVKVVVSKDDMAMYFSRLPIPYVREKKDSNLVNYLKHIGIYAYSYKFLKIFINLNIGSLEQLEKLEQLRVLENGYKIKILYTNKVPIDINTQSDIDNLNLALK